MASFIVNLEIDQGGTILKTMTWKAGTPAAPVDLTGCTAKMQMRATVDSKDVLLELTTVNGGIVLGGVTGTVTINILAGQTSSLGWTSGVYDLKIIYPDNTARRLLSGTVTVSPQVTR